jgi:hypothetical protein
MEGEEAVKVFDLVVSKGNLPTKLEDLVPLSFIGSAAVKFYQTKVKLMDQLGMSEQQRKATLADGQDAGEMLLNIEARIGELSYSVPDAPHTRHDHLAAKGHHPEPEKPERMGLTGGRVESAQAIHREMKKPGGGAVAAVIKQARENEDIPTKTAVLNKIKLDKVIAGRGKVIESKPDINEVAYEVFQKLSFASGKLRAIWNHWDSVSSFNQKGIIGAIKELNAITGGNK